MANLLELVQHKIEFRCGLLASLYSGDGAVHAVNVRNHGTLPNLPDRSVIEVSCEVGKAGAKPIPTSPLTPEIAGLARPM